jgi:lipoprotein NlpI
LCREFERDEEFDKAVACLERGSVLQPDDVQDLTRLGLVRQKQGLYDESIETLLRAAQRAPAASEPLVGLGLTHLLRGDYEQARESERRALSLNPLENDVPYFLAVIDFVEGRTEAAAAGFERYLASAASPRFLAIIRLSLLWRQLGRAEQAEGLLAKHAAASRDDQWETALLQFHQGLLAEEEFLAKARDRQERCEAFFYVGYKYWLRGEREMAVAYLRRVLETQVYEYFEYRNAQELLLRLQEGPAASPAPDP